MTRGKKVLIIDESALFREYLESRLRRCGLDVVQGTNGLDGGVKLRQELPDLLIMDYYLTRKTSIEILQEKQENPNTADIPTIMVSGKIDKNRIIEVARYGVKKVLTKPIQLNVMVKAISEVLNMKLTMDSTPCVIEAHFNDDILFIEIARGLNDEKVDLLRYKIRELLTLYKAVLPKVLIMMSDVQFDETDDEKLEYLLRTVIEAGGASANCIKVLTKSDFVKQFIASRKEYSRIAVLESLEKAMDELIGLKPDSVAHDVAMRAKLLSAAAPGGEQEESFLLRFDAEAERAQVEEAEGGKRSLSLAVVDDDMIIRELVRNAFAEAGFTVAVFENGREFVTALQSRTFDLVFLDLIMPEMDGFQVLEFLRNENIQLPIIVFSALSMKETVVKAVSYGIHSYMIKPLKPERLFRKAAEILQTNF